MALQGTAASNIQDFQSLMSECLWQGKEPDEGGSFTFPFQDTELELEPDQRFASQPQTPQTGCGTGGGSGFEPGGQQREGIRCGILLFPPGIYRKEEVPSSCTGWGVGFFFFFFFWLHKAAAGAAVPGEVITRRDPQEGSSAGRQQKPSQGRRVDWEQLWSFSPAEKLHLMVHGKVWRAGAGWAFPQQECGRLWGRGRMALISTEELQGWAEHSRAGCHPCATGVPQRQELERAPGGSSPRVSSALGCF